MNDLAFFELVRFDFELPELLVELSLESFLVLGDALTPHRERLRQGCERLLLHKSVVRFSGQLILPTLTHSPTGICAAALPLLSSTNDNRIMPATKNAAIARMAGR